METMNREAQGSQPPRIMTVEEQLAKMRAGKKEVHSIKLGEYTIPVRVLTVDEVNAIRRDAIRQASLMVNGDETDINLARQKETLKLATKITSGGAPILGDKALNAMTVDELSYLYDEYIRVMDSVNPNLNMMDPMQFRELVDALKKKAIFPRDCSLPQLREICSAFVDLILRLETPTSPQGSSSGGQPAE